LKLKVLETNPNDSNWKDFVNFHKQLYSKSEIQRVDTVPITGVDGVCLLAILEDKAVGRCVVFPNRRTQEAIDCSATLGYYECKPQEAFARILLKEAEAKAQSWGLKSIIGPVNGFSSWDSYRFKTSLNAKPFFMENHHLDYYPFQWQENGFHSIKKYFSHRVDQVVYDSFHLNALSAEMHAKGFEIHPFSLSNPEQELESLYSLILEGFADGFLFQSITRKEFVLRYLKALPMIKPEYVFLAKNKEALPIGFLFAYLDVLDPSGKTLVVKTLVRRADSDFKGVGQWLSNELMKRASVSGIETVIPAYMAENARSHFTASLFDSKQSTEYRLFSKDVY